MDEGGFTGRSVRPEDRIVELKTYRSAYACRTLGQPIEPVRHFRGDSIGLQFVVTPKRLLALIEPAIRLTQHIGDSRNVMNRCRSYVERRHACASGFAHDLSACLSELTTLDLITRFGLNHPTRPANPNAGPIRVG